MEEIPPDQGLELGQGLRRRVVLGHVAGRVAPDEGEARAGPERHRADEEVAEGRIRSAVFAEGELGQGPSLHGLAQEVEEAVAGGRGLHGREAGARRAAEAFASALAGSSRRATA